MGDLKGKITNEEVVIAGCIVSIKFASEPDPMPLQNMKRILFDSASIVQNAAEI